MRSRRFRWRFERDFREYYIADVRDAEFAPEDALRRGWVNDAWLVREWVWTLVDDVFHGPRLYELLRETSVGLESLPGRQSDIVSMATRLILSGRLRLYPAERAFEVLPVPLDSVDDADPESATSGSAAYDTFNLRVVYDSSEVPVPDVEILLDMGNGGTLKKVTDNNGEIELRQVRSDRLGVASDLRGCHAQNSVIFATVSPWRTSRGESEPSHEGNEDEQPSLKRVVKVEEYQARAGDTLQSIADQHGTSADDLGYFNFATRDAGQVNKRLQEWAGASGMASDGRTVAFAKGDAPGIVYVPRPLELRNMETGREHVMRVRRIIRNVELGLHVRLPIDPDDASSIDDRFTLWGGHTADAREYEQTKTTRDDLVEGDDHVDLVFTDLSPDLRYWLEIDPGKEGDRYFAFEDRPWSQIESLLKPCPRRGNGGVAE